MECPEALDVMGDALEGTLVGVTRAGFEEHIGECASCGSYYEQLRITVTALRNLPPGEPSPQWKDLLEAFRRETRRGTG